MTFRDIIKNDVKTVFLNAAEFADTHILNGQSITAVIDDDTINDDISYSVSGGTQRSGTGLYGGVRTIYVAAADVKKPKPGAALEVDGVSHTVVSTSKSGDMYIIKAKRTGGR